MKDNNATFEEFVSSLRSKLKPHNDKYITDSVYDVVKLEFKKNYGYVDGKIVRDAIDCFESRALAAYVLGEQLNDLEQLAVLLLLESALEI